MQKKSYLIWKPLVLSLIKNKTFFFEKPNNQKQKQNVIFQLCQFSIFFDQNFMDWSWVSRIDWCEGHWCDSTHMVVRLSDITQKWPKNTKKCAKLRSHFAHLKKHRTHAHRNLQPKWVRTRTSQLATCDRTSQVMSWYLESANFVLNYGWMNQKF